MIANIVDKVVIRYTLLTLNKKVFKSKAYSEIDDVTFDDVF